MDRVDSQDVKKGAVWIFRGRAIQAEDTANAKALRQ